LDGAAVLYARHRNSVGRVQVMLDAERCVARLAAMYVSDVRQPGVPRPPRVSVAV
jgi:hypothetical protein